MNFVCKNYLTNSSSEALEFYPVESSIESLEVFGTDQKS